MNADLCHSKICHVDKMRSRCFRPPFFTIMLLCTWYNGTPRTPSNSRSCPGDMDNACKNVPRPDLYPLISYLHPFIMHRQLGRRKSRKSFEGLAEDVSGSATLD